MKTIIMITVLSVTMASTVHADYAAVVKTNAVVAQNIIKGKSRAVGVIKKGAAINIEETGYNWVELTSAPIRRDLNSSDFVDWFNTCSGQNRCYVDKADIEISK